LHYAADGEVDEPPKWRQAIDMPRWASRITLEVIRVRVEPIHDISHADALAEGTDHFPELWDECYAGNGYGFHENPWVWVIDFSLEGEPRD
jgi:hypothetical protein